MGTFKGLRERTSECSNDTFPRYVLKPTKRLRAPIAPEGTFMFRKLALHCPPTARRKSIQSWL